MRQSLDGALKVVCRFSLVPYKTTTKYLPIMISNFLLDFCLTGWVSTENVKTPKILSRLHKYKEPPNHPLTDYPLGFSTAINKRR